MIAVAAPAPSPHDHATRPGMLDGMRDGIVDEACSAIGGGATGTTRTRRREDTLGDGARSLEVWPRTRIAFLPTAWLKIELCKTC